MKENVRIDSVVLPPKSSLSWSSLYFGHNLSSDQWPSELQTLGNRLLGGEKYQMEIFYWILMGSKENIRRKHIFSCKNRDKKPPPPSPPNPPSIPSKDKHKNVNSDRGGEGRVEPCGKLCELRKLRWRRKVLPQDPFLASLLKFSSSYLQHPDTADFLRQRCCCCSHFPGIPFHSLFFLYSSRGSFQTGLSTELLRLEDPLEELLDSAFC